MSAGVRLQPVVNESAPLSPMAWLWLTFGALLATLPIWVATYPPMVDLPQHAAQIRALDELIKGKSQFADMLEINAFVPYILAYGIALMLSQFLTVTASTKIVLSLAVVGLPFATAYLLRQCRTDPLWALLTLPTAYGFAMNWGQINFVLGVPVGLILLGMSSRYARRPTLVGGLLLLLLTHLLFFTHILLLFFFGALAGMFVIFHAGSLRAAAASLWPLLALAPTGLAWGLPIIGTTENNWHTPTRWELGWNRLTGLPELMLGTPATVASTIVCAMLFLLPLLGGAQFSRQIYRYFPLALGALVVFLAPNSIFGDFFIYQRFSLVLLPLYLLALDPPPAIGKRSKKLAMIGALLLVVAWSGLITNRYYGHDLESQDFQTVMKAMEPGKKVMSLVIAPQSRFSTAPVYLHYPTWYQAEHGGLVDFSFAGFYGQVVRYKLGKAPPIDGNFVWAPWVLDWERHNGAFYDYVIARTPDVTDRGPLNLDNCQASVLIHQGRWWLYKVNASKPPRC